MLFKKKRTIIKLKKKEGGIMIKIYQSDELGNIQEAKEIVPGTWIDITNPTTDEIENLSTQIDIDTEFINYILDDEEQPRIDIGKDKKLIIIDIPVKKQKHHQTIIQTIPLAILIIRDDYIITVSKENEILEDFKTNKVKEFYSFKKSRFIIQILYRVATSYLRYLKVINEEIEKCEEKMFQATKNEDLSKLLTIEKSLVYIVTSLQSNKAVLEKIIKGTVIDFYEEDRELLEDAIIENDQAMETSHLYREILSSTTDSFATIISNNLNTIMKFLAGITIVISIPTMVASFLGMNVPLGNFAENPYAFWILILISLIASLIVAIILRKKNML